MSTSSEDEIVQEPSMAKNSSPSRAPKNGAQLRENPEEREKRPKRPKNPVKPPGRHKHRHTARRNNIQISSANRVRLPMNLHVENMKILPKARGLAHERSTTARRNNVQIFKCELGLRIGVHFHVENKEIRLKAAHLSLHIYGHVNNKTTTRTAPVVATTGISPPCPRTAPVESRRNLLHNRNVHHSEDLGQDSNLLTVGTCRC